MMAARPPRTCAAHSVIEGRLMACQAWSRWGAASIAPAVMAGGYDATVTGGFALVARRGELAEDVAGGSGLRKDGPSMRMVMQ